MAPERHRPTEEIESGSFSRHTKSAQRMAEKAGDEVDLNFPSLSRGGVEQARETARRDLIEVIERAPQNALLFIGGKSDQARTGETGEVYGEELKALSQQREDLFVLTKHDVELMQEETKTSPGTGKTIDRVVEAVNQNPDKRVVVTYPLWIKELSYAYDNRWTDAKGKKTDYFAQLVEKYHGSHAEAVHDWIANQGRLELPDGRVLQGPKPEKVAREYLRGLGRLQQFARDTVPDRPVMVHGVGHQWDLDAVATYLAEGKVDKENFDKVSGGTVINNSEMVSDIVVSPDGKTSVNYRGQHFDYSPPSTDQT